MTHNRKGTTNARARNGLMQIRLLLAHVDGHPTFNTLVFNLPMPNFPPRRRMLALESAHNVSDVHNFNPPIIGLRMSRRS